MFNKIKNGIKNGYDGIKNDHVKFSIFKFSITFIIAGAAALILVLLGTEGLKIGGLMLSYVFIPAGKGFILAAPFLRLNVWVVIFALLFVDALISSFVLLNWNFITRFPLIGKLFLKSERFGQKAIKKNPWIKNFFFLGAALYVAIPFYGTGTIIGTIIGKLIGLKPANVLVAVLIGSFINSLIVLPIYFGMMLAGWYVPIL